MWQQAAEEYAKSPVLKEILRLLGGLLRPLSRPVM